MLLRTILRCEVYPHEFGQSIQRISGGKPVFPKGAGVEFQFAIFESKADRTLANIASIASIGLRINDTTSGGTLLMDSATAGASVIISPSLSLTDWDAGISQHIRILFPSAQTNVTAGKHYLKLYGITTEGASSYIVLGDATAEIKDVGTLGAASAPPATPDYATMSQLVAYVDQRLANVPKLVGDQGVTQTWTGADGSRAELYIENGEPKWNLYPAA